MNGTNSVFIGFSPSHYCLLITTKGVFPWLTAHHFNNFTCFPKSLLFLEDVNVLRSFDKIWLLLLRLFLPFHLLKFALKTIQSGQGLTCALFCKKIFLLRRLLTSRPKTFVNILKIQNVCVEFTNVGQFILSFVKFENNQTFNSNFWVISTFDLKIEHFIFILFGATLLVTNVTPAERVDPRIRHSS